MAGVSDIIVEAEDILAEFDNALHVDALQREEQARKAAEELVEQQHLLEEKETKCITSECAKRQMYEELLKEYGGEAGSAIHVLVSIHFVLVVFTHSLVIL